MPVKHYRVNRPVKAEVGWYSEDQKLEAFALYLTLGNMVEVSNQLKINLKTLYKWKYSDWWKEQLKELEQGNKIKLGTKVSKLLSKSSINLEDRLDNGNLVWNPSTRELERRPLSSKEVVEIFRASVQAQEMVDKANEAFNNRDLKELKAQEQLDKLKEIAEKLGVKPAPLVIDVEPVVTQSDTGVQPIEEDNENGMVQQSSRETSNLVSGTTQGEPSTVQPVDRGEVGLRPGQGEGSEL